MGSDWLYYHISRLPGFHRLWQHIPIGSLDRRVLYGVFKRPHYAFGVHSAAKLAKSLGIDTISVIEFGVGSGEGLIALESLAREIGSGLGVKIVCYGFDCGQGLPEPLDYRDLMHVWAKGDYRMDESELRSRLSSARLVIGDVRDTIDTVLEDDGYRLPPVGFIAFDLDFYSSTMAAFRIFEANHGVRLPRILCYFDDVMYPSYACYCEYTGELLAIREFNETHECTKLCPYHMLKNYFPRPGAWQEQFYVLHDFSHPLYTKYIGG